MLYSFVGKGLSSLYVFFSKCNNSSLGADNTNINFLGVFSILNSFNVFGQSIGGKRWVKQMHADHPLPQWAVEPQFGQRSTSRGHGEDKSGPGQEFMDQSQAFFDQLMDISVASDEIMTIWTLTLFTQGGTDLTPLHIFAYNIFCNFSAEYTTFDPIEMYRKTLCFYLIFITNWVE